MVLGDFNIHINNSTNSEVQAFVTLMEAAGLQQHVKEATHNHGNILDHVYTEQESSITVKSCEVKDFISDHGKVC
jgi:hypothetical protein